MYIVSIDIRKKRWLSHYNNVTHSNSKHTAFEFHPSRPYLARYYTIFSFSIHFGYKNTGFLGYICLVLYVYVKALYGLK